MSDQNFREIQLSGKQLVFLFMASVVLAVAVFLLGVSVGRGVRDVNASTASAETPAAVSLADAEPPDVMPAPTETSGADATFEQILPDRPAGTAQADTITGAPPPVSEPVAPVTDTSAPPVSGPPAADAVAAREPASPPDTPARTAAPTRQPSPQTSTTARTPATASRSTGAGQWTVQVNAYRSRASADREAASLVQKGFEAYVDASGRDGLFRVRVGSYPDRAAADRTAARLRQEGIRPSVTR